MRHINLYIQQFLIMLILACVGVFAPVTQVQANDKYSALVMDADTGAILFQRYADKMLHPASMTKAMTLLMVFDEIRAGRMDLDDEITMTKHAASMVPSKLGIKPGGTIKVEDAILALVTKSANDVAAAIGDHIGGSEDNFAKMMTQKARDIGMSRTRFTNASGLHHPKQVSTARDMAKMGQYLIRYYPKEYRYFSTTNFSYRGHNYHNHNRLMDSYDGMDGIKTGYVQAAGFNLLASAERNNRRLIGVVFGGRTTRTRNAHMREILNDGFKDLPKLQETRDWKPAPLPEEKPEYIKAMGDMQQAQVKSRQPWASPRSQNTSQILQVPQRTGQGDASPNITSYKQAQEAGIWSIQIGAFRNRDATDKVLNTAPRQLPSSLRAKSQPLIAPLSSDQGWVYRAWLTGFSRAEADEACRHYKECLTIAPKSY